MPTLILSSTSEPHELEYCIEAQPDGAFLIYVPEMPGLATEGAAREAAYCIKYCTRSGRITTVPTMDRDEIAARITRAGKRRTKAMEAKREASQELAELIPLARQAGIGVTELVKLSGMSHRGVYDMLERRS